MNAKICIFVLIFVYLIMQNFLSIYVLNISLDFKLRKLSTKHYKRFQKKIRLKFNNLPKQEWNKNINYSMSPTPINKTKTISASLPVKPIDGFIVKRDAKSLQRHLIGNTHQQQQPRIYGKSYHYQHMKNFTKMIGLHDKLKERFSQNLNSSFPFKYIIKNENLCRRDIYLLNLLLSAPGDFQIRSDIRSMWGSPRWKRITRFQVVHLLGKSEDEKTNEKILSENEQFGDIVQIDFQDSYDNLTLKVLSGLHWTEKFCQNVEWVMKSDVDVIINVFRLVRYSVINPPPWPRHASCGVHRCS